MEEVLSAWANILSRPSIRTDAVVDEILMRMSEGEPLAVICRDEHMPAFSTVWRWEQSDETFCNLSQRAREHGTHFLAGDCVRISDDLDIDPAHKRIMVDTRLRLIGKWNAKAYGDKLALGGAEDLPAIKTETTVPKLQRLIDAGLSEEAALRVLAGPE